MADTPIGTKAPEAAMLEDLTVKDFALIESVSLDFGKGLNILSGETGAGKSILIGSLTFLLGGKADVDSVRTGADEARVSGTVLLERDAVKARDWLESRGIAIEGDRVLLRRSLRSSGKSGAWIQDTPVTRNELAEFTSFLVDIHGQHDHQSLLKVDEHRRFLDAYAGIEGEVAAFSALFAELASKRKARDEMNASESDRQAKIELLSFAIGEIRKAAIKTGEEDELEAESQRLSQHEKLYSLVDQSTELLGSADGAVPILKKSRALLEQASTIDPTLSQAVSRIEGAFYELEDAAATVRQYRASLVFDPARLEAVEERLSALFKLRKKYGATIAEVVAYAENAGAQLAQLTDREANRSTLDAAIADLEKRVIVAATAISAKRTASAKSLREGVESILRTLGMATTTFAVELGSKESTSASRTVGPYGFDTVEFMISANAGEPLKPLTKIASGGEISRVMLALKTVLADADEIGTLIFDEIDAGIGGEVALSVGGHLKKLSERKQILCITHLASIAVRADNQVKIEKSVVSGKTVTRAFPVAGPARTEEIARMLAGDGFSSASLKHAEELLRTYAG
jgi:DNA repair protein RecN (Recombination protein N)